MKLPELRNVVLKKVKTSLPIETQEFLEDLTDFLLNSDFLSEEANLYLTHDYWTFNHIYNQKKLASLLKAISCIEQNLSAVGQGINMYEKL